MEPMIFPRWMYCSNGESRIVYSQAEYDALEGNWGHTPAIFNQSAPEAAPTESVAPVAVVSEIKNEVEPDAIPGELPPDMKIEVTRPEKRKFKKR